ncbi:MAG: ArsB/NhaD family transporter [Eubacteriales bacterium]|nr:ArsB/NhaD family transporter [Eubacteriales bacterium]MDY3333032.1 ArsB/NhaD family transporter [Gallibacter sp.]
MNAVISVIIFIVIMSLIVLERIHKTVAALAGAALLLLMKVFNFDTAISYVDFNTIGVLLGMMIFVAVIKRSGMFEYIAIRSAKIAKGDPWRIMVIFMFMVAFLSAFLDNVTTVLLIAPMTIAITRMLDINPVPFLLTQVFASNIGGTATLIGDPPNIMIGSSANLSFIDFIKNTAPVSIVIMLALVIMMRLLYGKKLQTTQEDIDKIMLMRENDAITNIKLFRISIIAILLLVIVFIMHATLKIDTASIAIAFGVGMLFFTPDDAEQIIFDVEWSTLLFFIGLFVVVGGMVETGVVESIAQKLLEFTNGNPKLTMIILLWGSALFSSILDNIPFVATLIPMITAMEAAGVNVTSFWWAISLGACLGGNGTLVGASANVIIAGVSNRYGHEISFRDFTKVGFPVMVVSIMISTAYLLLFY